MIKISTTWYIQHTACVLCQRHESFSNVRTRLCTRFQEGNSVHLHTANRVKAPQLSTISDFASYSCQTLTLIITDHPLLVWYVRLDHRIGCPTHIQVISHVISTCLVSQQHNNNFLLRLWSDIRYPVLQYKTIILKESSRQKANHLFKRQECTDSLEHSGMSLTLWCHKLRSILYTDIQDETL